MKKLLFLLLFIPLVSVGQTSNEYYKMGYEKSLSKDYSGAINDYTKSLELNPNSSPAYYNRGLVKYRIKDYYGSIADYTKGIEIINASIDKLNNQGKELDDKGTAITNQVLGDFYYNRAISRWYINDLTGACEDAKKSESLGVRFSEMIEDACN
jgi:tetratricopeptide (TPR) repeat protein